MIDEDISQSNINKECESNAHNFSDLNEHSHFHTLRRKNLNKLILAQLNINSLRNKFDLLMSLIKNNVDILMISERKLEESFPDGKFTVKGYSKPFRLDRNKNGGGIMLYVREDIPARLISVEKSPIEAMFIEINLRNRKWLFCCSYNPNKATTERHIEALSKSIYLNSSLYDNFIFLGDFNTTIKETSVKDFCDFYNLRSLINVPTCFKNYNNPTCIDLILTNRARSFQNSCTIETGLSDFHKMIVTVMKTTFRKLPPKVIYYRDFRNFDNKNYRQAVLAASRNCIGQSSDGNCDHFFSICSELLDWYAPRKKKFIRGNQARFWNRELSKEAMKRTRLRNKFLKYKTIEYQEEYNKQRNYCVSLLRKTKRSYYENLNERNVTDTKNFWKTVKPYLSNKNISNSKITLVENDTILTEDKKVAKELNDFFSTIVMNLGISRPNNFDPLSENIRDKTIQAIVKYRDHPSIVAIRNKCNRTPYFIFPNVSAEEISKEIRKLDPSKSSHDNDIPTKIIKENADIFSEFICMSVNHSIDNNIFPSTLKLANITPVFKKGSANSKENYRPVSILPNLSKIFERCMFKHMGNYFEEHFLSKYQCGFRKGFSAQHCLMALLEKWKTCVDQKQICGALLTDFSKAFDCLPHDLIIAKLNAYGFSLSALRLIHDYLSNRKQRTKINLTYS